MRFALIAPKAESAIYDGHLKKLFNMYTTTLPHLVPYIPKGIDFKVFSGRENNNIPLEEFDAIGISENTSAANNAHILAKRAQKIGIPVILGGTHATAMFEEEKKYGVVVRGGHGGPPLEMILNRLQKGLPLEEHYDAFTSPTKFRSPRRDVMKKRFAYEIAPVSTTVGCPWNCNYCSVKTLYGNTFFHYPIDEIIKDIKTVGKHFFFVDDNLSYDQIYAEELMKQLTPLNKKWAMQAVSSLGNKEQESFVDLAYDAGLRAVYFGLDGVTESSLKEAGAGHKRNPIQKTLDQIARIHDKGILIEIGFVVGYDHDTEETFDLIQNLIDKSVADSAIFHILTPYPGTALFNKLKKQNRITTFDWSKYNTGNLTFELAGMPKQVFMDRYNRLWEYNLSISRIWKTTRSSPNPIITLGKKLATKNYRRKILNQV
ncbi:radical SAM protein [archaeon]|nr:radical SAM protein [archaeon]